MPHERTRIRPGTTTRGSRAPRARHRAGDRRGADRVRVGGARGGVPTRAPARDGAGPDRPHPQARDPLRERGALALAAGAAHGARPRPRRAGRVRRRHGAARAIDPPRSGYHGPARPPPGRAPARDRGAVRPRRPPARGRDQLRRDDGAARGGVRRHAVRPGPRPTGRGVSRAWRAAPARRRRGARPHRAGPRDAARLLERGLRTAHRYLGHLDPLEARLRARPRAAALGPRPLARGPDLEPGASRPLRGRESAPHARPPGAPARPGRARRFGHGGRSGYPPGARPRGAGREARPGADRGLPRRGRSARAQGCQRLGRGALRPGAQGSAPDARGDRTAGACQRRGAVAGAAEEDRGPRGHGRVLARARRGAEPHRARRAVLLHVRRQRDAAARAARQAGQYPPLRDPVPARLALPRSRRAAPARALEAGPVQRARRRRGHDHAAAQPEARRAQRAGEGRAGAEPRRGPVVHARRLRRGGGRQGELRLRGSRPSDLHGQGARGQRARERLPVGVDARRRAPERLGQRGLRPRGHGEPAAPGAREPHRRRARRHPPRTPEGPGTRRDREDHRA